MDRSSAARKHHVYTLWASMKEDPAPWMIAAEDEFSWEGDPDRCEAAFKVARDKAEADDYEVREVTLLIDYGQVMRAFEPAEIEAEVETK